MGLILPGTPRYERLSCFERFDAVEEVVAEIQARGAMSPETKVQWEEFRQEREYQRGLCILADPIWDMEHHFILRDEGGKEVFFTRSALQRDFLAKVEAKRLAGTSAQFIVMKRARAWISTAVGLYYVQRVMREDGKYALVVAHDAPTAKEVFGKVYKFTYDRMVRLAKDFPGIAAPEIKYNTKTELEFEDIGSKLMVRNVGAGTGLGAGFGIHYLHITEAGRLEQASSDVATTVTTMLNTMATDPGIFTLAVFEGTTEQGQTWFVDEWQDPDSPMEKVFYAWFDRCQEIPFADQSERISLVASLSEEEKALRERHPSITLEMIKWRRHVFKTQIKVKGGTDEHKRRLMRLRFPSTPQDCIQAGGSGAFSAEKINILLLHPRCHGPKGRGRLILQSGFKPLLDEVTGSWRRETPQAHFREDESGDLEVWEHPRPNHRYTIGLDWCHGANTDESDYTAAMAFDRDEQRFVALLRAKKGPRQLLEQIRLMWRWYNDAWLCPETNGFESDVEDLGKTDLGGNLYRRRVSATAVGLQFRDIYGWAASNTANAAIVKILDEAMETRPRIFTIPILLTEMSTYEVEKGERLVMKYVGAKKKGKNDDVVDAAGMALWCDRLMPLEEPGPKDLMSELAKKEVDPMQMDALEERYAQYARDQARRDEQEGELNPHHYDEAMG